jgi:tRNA-specific 2-thiouridylase
VNWLIDLPQESLRCQLKIRYLSQPVGATIEPAGAGRFTALLDEPKHGVAPGQAAVCYDGDRVLGGGWIA